MEVIVFEKTQFDSIISAIFEEFSGKPKTIELFTQALNKCIVPVKVEQAPQEQKYINVDAQAPLLQE